MYGVPMFALKAISHLMWIGRPIVLADRNQDGSDRVVHVDNGQSVLIETEAEVCTPEPATNAMKQRDHPYYLIIWDVQYQVDNILHWRSMCLWTSKIYTQQPISYDVTISIS